MVDITSGVVTKFFFFLNHESKNRRINLNKEENEYRILCIRKLIKIVNVI